MNILSIREQGALELQRRLQEVIEDFDPSVIKQCESLPIQFRDGFVQISYKAIAPKVSDKQLIEKLKKILDSADKQATSWRTPTTTDDEYEEYRDWCFLQVWDLFWETVKQIEVDVKYCDPDTTYEADMQARLDSYEGVDWFIELKEDL